MTFKEFKAKFQQNLPDTSVALYQLNVPKEMLWDTFITSFPEEEQAEYTCNCCKSFVRAYGGLVSLVDYKPKSIWEVEGITDPVFANVVKQMSLLLKGESIRDVFVTETRKLGTDNNKATLADGSIVTWDHMFVELSKNYPFVVAEDQVATKRADLSSVGSVFLRALQEISIDSLETVLDLISQNSIYKGEEYESFVMAFLDQKKEYEGLAADQKQGFGWFKSTTITDAISRFKNSSIGSLALAISEGEELDLAVKKYESKVAPENYKRPQAVFSKRQVEEAEKTIANLGLSESLGRRFAHKDDVDVSEVLFVDRSVAASGIFAELKEEVVVNPKTFAKVEEVAVQDFIEKILPKVTGIELLVENQHINNFVSLIAPQNAEAPSLFKWKSPLSWSYRNALADSSMKQRVIAAGGRVDGVFRFTQSWNNVGRNESLMDLHVFMPGNEHDPSDKKGDYYGKGKRVGWNNRKDTASGGIQDVDYTSNAPEGYVPVENITFPNLNAMPDGKYICKIHNWAFRGNTVGGGTAEIEFGGQVFEYEYPKLGNKEWCTVAIVTLKNGEFTIEHKLKEKQHTQKVWGISTMQFHKVNFVTQSPNYWGDDAVGNRHLFFMIDKAQNENEPVRGFFNEYLNPELDKHRKVFEALGGRLKVAPSEVQVSGLGYSSTKKDSVIVKLTGTFTRTIKIKF